jgi:hypothetical protein
MKEHTKRRNEMSSEQTHKPETQESNSIEDLTLDEAKTENVKGGRFAFGVEREMKESGEKGGTSDV